MPFVVFTNGSAYPPAEQAKRLRSLGLPVADERMLTPSSVAAELMSRHRGPAGAGTGQCRGVGHALSAAGIATTYAVEPNASEVDAVYVGWHSGMHDERHRGGLSGDLGRRQTLRCLRTCRSLRPSKAEPWVIPMLIVGAIRCMTKALSVLTGKPSLHALRFAARTRHSRCATWASSVMIRRSRSSWLAAVAPSHSG